MVLSGWRWRTAAEWDPRPRGFRSCAGASDELLSKVRVEARGRALRWEEQDEDITVEDVLAGRWPA